MLKPTVNVVFEAQRIDAVFAELDQCRLPGAAVGIAIGGRPVYRRGFGLANMELPTVLSPGIRMRIGSTTKHFACLAYMLLCEEGKAGLDDPIGKHISGLHPVTRDVTMRQLMSNTSGLRDALDICWQFSGTGRVVSSADVLSLYRDIDDVNALPDTAWIYNNGAWVLLSAAIERIADQSLEEVLLERIFTPVGMADTLLRRWDTDFVPNSATLHMTTPSGGFEKSYIGTEDTGEGGIVSTVDDMLRWLAHLDNPVVGAPATWAAMTSPQILENGTSTGYGFGLMLGRYRGVATLGHSGGVMGGNAQMLKIPAAGLDIVILVNRHDVFAVELAEKVMDACLTNLQPARAATQRRPVTGCFCSHKTGRVVHLLAKEGRQYVAIDGYEMPVEPDESDVWWPVGIFSYVKQGVAIKGHNEEPTSLELWDFGTRDELQAVRPARRGEEEIVEGRYLSKGTGTELHIGKTAGRFQMSATGRFGSVSYDLECLALGTWHARSRTSMPWGGVLSFDESHTQFRYSNNWRTRALRFQRLS